MNFDQQTPRARPAYAGRRDGTAWHAVFWIALALLALATVGAPLAPEWGAALSAGAIGLAAATLALALLLRRNVGAVVALVGGVAQAVWLLPALVAPGMTVQDVPDGARRVAVIDRAASGFASANAVDPAPGWPGVTPARTGYAAPPLVDTMLRHPPADPDSAPAAAAPSAEPEDLFAIRVRADGTIVIEWLGHSFETDEVPGLLRGGVPEPQRI